MKRNFQKIILLLGAVLLTTLWLPNQVSAQGTNASIVGIVTDSQGEPLIGATVVATNESTGFSTFATTNVQGEYVMRQLPLGSPYKVAASFIGYGTETKTGYALNQGDQLNIKFKLSEESIHLDVVEVVANSLKNRIDQLGSSTAVTPTDIKALPVNGRNFTALTDLSPLSSGSNLAGQLFSSTSYTIDGMTAKSPLSSGTSNRGPYLVSMEAIREFEVVTNDYDVTMGRAGGGSVSSVTKSGTNTFHGSAFIYHRADQLSSKYDMRGNRRSDKYQISQYGFSFGGPIIKNRLHFFVSWDHQQDARPLYIADIQNKEDEIRYKISKQTLDQFLEIARSKYGVSNEPQTGSFQKVRPTNSIFARIDYQINATNLLTVRNNYNKDINTLGINDNSAINLYEVYGTHTTQDNSTLASLRSVLGPRLTNEAKFQYLYTDDYGKPNSQLPAANIPRAIVENVTSNIDGKDYTTTLQLGGQRYLPERFTNQVVQLVDNLYYSTKKVDYTFGIDLMYTHLNSMATSEMNGRFYYSGMDAFLKNQPYRYAREIPVEDPTVKQGILSSGVYGQAQFRLLDALDVSVGLRGDYTAFFANPYDNAVLTKELGLKTTHKVRAFQLQPRLQVTWDIGKRRKDIIRFGAGIFGSNMNNYAMVNNLEFDGNRVVAFDMSAANGQSLGITPDFLLYRLDPSKAPGAELFDQLGVAKIATFNINGPDVKVPTIYKFNISYNKYISDRFMLGASFYATLGRNNYMYVDANMAEQPFFRLENEGGRGVYVPASTINTARGTTDWTKGKKSEKIGRVLELNSKGKNNTYTAVFSGAYRYLRDGNLNVSYTINRSYDNTSYNGNVANSSTLYQMVTDDPRELSRMTFSDGQWGSKVVVYGTSPVIYGFQLGIRYSGIGGTRYSAVVNGNINGDFVTGNDLAFVFDPNSPATPANIRDGINALLNNPEVEKGFKDYLRDNFGKVAERNGGKNGFYGVMDLRLTKTFKIYKSHNIELSYDIFNFLNLLSKKWGASKNLGKQSLYNVAGFDPQTKTYKYNVNASAGIATPGGTPWQMQLGLRYSF